jgi:hypothetical protein
MAKGACADGSGNAVFWLREACAWDGQHCAAWNALGIAGTCGHDRTAMRATFSAYGGRARAVTQRSAADGMRLRQLRIVLRSSV